MAMNEESIEKLADDIMKLADDITQWIDAGLVPKRTERRPLQALCRQLRMVNVDLSSLKEKILKISPQPVGSVYDVEIEDLDVGKRVKHAIESLSASGKRVRTVGELLKDVRVSDLMSKWGFGRKSLADLNDCLDRLGSVYGVELEMKEYD